LRLRAPPGVLYSNIKLYSLCFFVSATLQILLFVVFPQAVGLVVELSVVSPQAVGWTVEHSFVVRAAIIFCHRKFARCSYRSNCLNAHHESLWRYIFLFHFQCQFLFVQCLMFCCLPERLFTSQPPSCHQPHRCPWQVGQQRGCQPRGVH